jgi:hypothetical protein
LPLEDSYTPAWKEPFHLSGEQFDVAHPVPQHIVDLSRVTWQSMEDGKGTDILAPALGGLGAALLLRNLARTANPEGKLLVVQAGISDLVQAYYRIKDTHAPPFAWNCPLVLHDAATGEASPVRGRYPREWPRPRWRLGVLESPDDIPFWKRQGDVRFLLLSETPDRLLSPRPEGAVAVFQRALRGSSIPTEVRTPVTLGLPVSTSVPPEGEEPYVTASYQRWYNASRCKIEVVTIPPETPALANLYPAYLRLRRWYRQQSAIVPPMVTELCFRIMGGVVTESSGPLPAGVGAPTEQYPPFIEQYYREREELWRLAEPFLTSAREILVFRRNHAPAKGEALRTLLSGSAPGSTQSLVLDSKYTVAQWRATEVPRIGGANLPDAMDGREARWRTSEKALICSVAPTPWLVEHLVDGGAPACTFLLYPWEARMFSFVARQLLSATHRLGVDTWPHLRSEDLGPLESIQSVVEEPDLARGFSRMTEEGPLTPEVPLLLNAEGPRPHRRISFQGGGESVVAEGETVIAKRGSVFVDVLAEDVSQGDVVVVPSGMGTIRAHRILERICSTRPAKMETFIQATAWRGHLTDFVNRKYKDHNNKQWKIVDIYRDIRSKEVPPFDYAALRNWLRSDEPVAPEPENLRWLYRWMGWDAEWATKALEARKIHLKDRRELYTELLAMNQGRQAELWEVTARSAPQALPDPGRDRSLPLEDLRSLIAFRVVAANEIIAQRDPE